MASGDFTLTAVDPVLHCMHAAMSQTPVGCVHLTGRARERTVDEYAETVLLLAGSRLR